MNLRLWSACFILVLSSFTVKAQNNPYLSDSYLAISGGVACPLGNLSSTSGSDWSGYAQIGYNLNISTGISLYHSFGIAAMIGYFRNNYDINTFLTNFSYSNPSSYLQSAAEPYIQKCGLLGLFKTIQTSDRSWIDMRAMIGFAITDYPNPQWTTVDTTTRTQWSVNVAETSSFAFDLGGGARYLISDRCFFMLDLDFFYTRPAYSGVLQQNNSTLGGSSELTSGHLGMAYILLDIGIGYKLWK